MGSWDRGLDYEYTYSKILRHMQRAKSDVALCYDAILLLQLRNGLRISEAVRAFKHFLRSHSVEFKNKRLEEEASRGETSSCPARTTRYECE
jgi:hypothetical protein